MDENLKVSKRTKIMYILKILKEKTDLKHSLTMKEIIEELNYIGIFAEKKSIIADIKLLIDMGFGIEVEKSNKNKYSIIERDFELSELKLLVSAIESSKFITKEKSEKLIKKVCKLTSNYEAEQLYNEIFDLERVKSSNKSIYYNINSIREAVIEKKKITFEYFDYNLELEKEFRKEVVLKSQVPKNKIYEVSPFKLIWSNENIYLIAKHRKYKNISHFRIDRMRNVTISHNEISKEEEQNIAKINGNGYLKKNFGMYSGVVEEVAIEFENNLINPVVDQFGEDITIYDKTIKNFKILVKVVPEKTFFGWMLIFGKRARIVSPESVKYKIQDHIRETLEVYKKNSR